MSLCAGNAEKLREAIAAGADIAEEDEDGRRPLHYAAFNSQVECIKVSWRRRAACMLPLHAVLRLPDMPKCAGADWLVWRRWRPAPTGVPASYGFAS
jgi:ankyrin repeat protein